MGHYLGRKQADEFIGQLDPAGCFNMFFFLPF